MHSERLALLIQSKPEPLSVLVPLLEKLGVATCSAGTVLEARELIRQKEPHLIFTDRALSDGSYAHVLELAKGLDLAANVIVVGSKNSLNEMTAVMTCGAFDFLVPPFDSQTLDLVVSVAVQDVLLRRQERIHQSGSVPAARGGI